MALSNPLEAFVWGAGGAQMTPEQIARQREIASALLNQAGDTSPVAHWTQGAARVVNALGGVMKERQANKAEASNAAESQSRIAALLGGMTGSGAAQFPPAPSGAGGVPVSAATMPQSAEAGVIRQGLIDRGLPEHVADAFVLNFQDESGLNPGINEANPTVSGSRGGYGLYQLTGPRRKAYEAFAGQRGVDPSDTNAQLDFLMSELQGPEAKAAQSILSAPDTGTAAAAIVNDFLRPAPEHRTSRANRYLAMNGQGGGSPAVAANEAMATGQPVQVASNDPSIGMAQAAVAAPDQQFQPGQTASTTDASNRVVQALTNPQSAGGADAGQPQVAQAAPAQSPGMNPGMQAAIAQALSSPSASPQERQIAGLLLQQQMEQQAAQNAPPKYDFMAGKDGAIFRTDNRGNMEQVYGGKPSTFRTLTPQEKASMGLPADGAYQIGADNKISQIGGGGTTVNIDQKSEGAFEKKLAENQATMFSGMAQDGLNARSDLAIIGELGSLLQGQGGTLTGVSGWLASKGIGDGTQGDLQAANALINKLIPTQRPVGSGSMSDRDVEMFRASLPSLWNTPGGNATILQTMQGLAQYRAAQGDIAARVMNGDLRRDEAIQRLRDLPNPLAGFERKKNPDKAEKSLKDMSDEELEAIINGKP